MQTLLCLPLLALLTGGPCAAQDLLPPVAPWSGPSEALVAKAGDPWRTPAEAMGLNDTPSYADTLAYLQRLAKASPLLKLVPFGSSAQGRTLYAVLAAKGGARTPRGLRAAGKPTLLAQAGIHAGEIDGKDAGLMLLRDLALGRKGALLDRANFLFVPVFNADGHERVSPWNRPNQRGPVAMGWRTTAQNLNLNRDYLKADAPEMRAMLGLYRDWAPDLVLDLHVTDGIDYQYDITFGHNGAGGGFAYSPRSAQWLDRHFDPGLTAALTAAGHLPHPLIFATNDRNLEAGLVDGNAPARFSNGYGDLRGIPTVLVENHSLKPYRQRVLGTYVLLEAALAALGGHGQELRAAIQADRAARPAQLPLTTTLTGGAVTTTRFQGIAYETYSSPASGIQEVRWTGRPKTYEGVKVLHDRPDLLVARPKAYWVPVTKPEVIQLLKLHGVRLTTLARPATVQVAMYRLTAPKPSALPVEGRHTLAAGVTTELHEEIFPAGSVRVDTDQPLGDLAMVLLEPQGPDSLLAWGFFPEILQRTEYIEGYVIAPMAERLLREQPEVKAQFEARLAAEPAFAADPRARLQWFYQRGPYFDQRYLLYPIGRE